MLCSGAFPLLPLLLLLIQVFEIRHRAQHVLTGVQRPPYRCVKGLRTINDFLDIQVALGFTLGGCGHSTLRMSHINKLLVLHYECTA